MAWQAEGKFNPWYLLGGIPGAIVGTADAYSGNKISAGIKGFWNDITGVTAAEQATQAQQAATEQAMETYSPYLQAGEQALAQQQALLGLSGEEAQQAAINAIQQGSEYQTLLKEGEASILQNAAATGGLRGGNTQGALAQYSPTLLNNLISQKYSQLGGLTGLGQNAASNVAGLQTGLGGINASNILGQYNLQRQFLSDAAGGLTDIATTALPFIL